jgi:hypothetical protein
LSLDNFFEKKFDSKNYHCGHFAAELYKHLTGLDKSKLADCPNLQNATDLIKLENFESPCLVFMRNENKIFHVGVGVTSDTVCHLIENGVVCDSVSYLLSLYKLSFYK